MQRVRLPFFDLFFGQLVVGNRVKALHALRHVTIRDALHFKLVHFHEIRDLFEAQGCVVHQPYGSGAGHNRFCHVGLSLKRTFPVA